MTRGILWAFLLLAAAGCTARLRPAPPPAPPLPGAEPLSVTALAARIDAAARRSDREPDSAIRGELAAAAERDADDCLAREPQAAACLYGRAVAQGLMARAHPARAGEFLNGMLDSLARAETADPNYDEAGPARVRALVLIRAPGWPLGPGDAEAGVVAARRAVALRPRYPPNLLALAEALAKSGDARGAQENYARAREAVLALPGRAAGGAGATSDGAARAEGPATAEQSAAAEGPATAEQSAAADREDWLRQADQGLRHK